MTAPPSSRRRNRIMAGITLGSSSGSVSDLLPRLSSAPLGEKG
jgi:hypothetical protein